VRSCRARGLHEYHSQSRLSPSKGNLACQLQADWATVGRGGEKLSFGWSRAAYVEFCVARADALLKQFPAFRRFRQAGE